MFGNVITYQKPVFFYQGNCDNGVARVALVSVSIESALLGYGVEIYHHVENLLEKKYNCSFHDCYKHPEYLNEVLKTISDNSRYKITQSIRNGLEEFSYIKPVSKFLGALNS